MIEPTESESKEECDLFIDAMRSIAEEAATNPDLVKTAPHSTRVRRLDEVGAARKPILRWDPSRQEREPDATVHKKHKHLEPTPVIPTV
jgi:glycine dehydrogenase subunit 2